MEYTSDNNPDYDAFHKKMRTRSKTKSTYRRVLKVYDIIIENEDSDSDYWCSGGNSLIINELIAFEHFDWTALENDLINWTPEQLLIIATALVQGDRLNQSKSIIAERSYLFAYIIAIADNTVAGDLLDDFEFIATGEAKPLDLLLAVKEKVDSITNLPYAVESKLNEEYWFSKVTVEKFYTLIKSELEKARG